MRLHPFSFRWLALGALSLAPSPFLFSSQQSASVLSSLCIMLFVNLALIVALLTPFYVVADGSQIPLAGPESSSPHQNRNNPPHVAIVGAGIASASTAFCLYELTRPFPSLPITIYESEFAVGGRAKSIFQKTLMQWWKLESSIS
jgi:hypothetical protein